MRGQAEFSRILSQNGQITLKVKVSDHCFQYKQGVSHDACLVQIRWFLLKYVTSFRAEKCKAYGRTDGQTGVGNHNTPLTWKFTG